MGTEQTRQPLDPEEEAHVMAAAQHLGPMTGRDEPRGEVMAVVGNMSRTELLQFCVDVLDDLAPEERQAKLRSLQARASGAILDPQTTEKTIKEQWTRENAQDYGDWRGRLTPAPDTSPEENPEQN